MTSTKQTPRFRNSSEIDVSKDGVDYINIYSRGKTRLGRNLSHFARTPFIHPYFGPFESMEGFWFYMKTGKIHDQLRYLYGNRAKQYGKNLATKYDVDFKEDILAGNYQKIIQNDGLRQAFINSELPLTHYYLFEQQVDAFMDVGVRKSIVIFPKNSDWLIDGLEEIRIAMKQDQVPECWTNAAKRYVSNVTDGNN